MGIGDWGFSVKEPFRQTLHGNLEDSKWKKISYIFFVLTVIFLAGSAIFIFLYFDNENNDDIITEWKWKPIGSRIKTRWAENLDQNKIWQEYPRPQLERKDWINLNGPWKYSIRRPEDLSPNPHDGYILVPFPIESALSGVMKTFTKDDILWYEKEVNIPKEWNGKHILLNFGAVDWKCEIYINKRKVGEHTGGYSYFYFDITNFLKDGKNKILLKVKDVTDTVYSTWGKYQPVGKQTITPNGIWYTSSSGIWQNVWLEPVNENFIQKVEINNDFDTQEIKIKFIMSNDTKLHIECYVKFNEQIVGENKGIANEEISIKLSNENFKPWSPSEPNIYIITAKLFSDSGKELDSITSYTTIRKIESKKDKIGKLRIFLNNKPLFNMGPLDQGFWPDGLYTPPSEEAMVYDIQKLKDLGFNAIRKHVKVEPFRYYYECDKIGMVVWQDMPSGNVDGSGSWDRTEAVVKFTQNKDNSRLINAASGGNHRPVGNFLDLHTYSAPSYPLQYDGLINVIGEYGGLGLEIKNHTWKDDNWGYQVLNDKLELTNRYIEYINNLIELIPQGISAAIYTQTTDVEGEINGLMTYDRNETKIYHAIKGYHEKLISSLSE